MRVTVVSIAPRPAGNYEESCHRDEHYERRRTVDRTFRFEANDASSLSLTFAKDGHESRAVMLAVEPTAGEDCHDSGRIANAPPPEPVRREDLVVTLPRVP